MKKEKMKNEQKRHSALIAIAVIITFIRDLRQGKY